MRSSQIRVDPKFNETEKKTQSSIGKKAGEEGGRD